MDGVDWHRALLRDFSGGDRCGSGWWPHGVLLPESWLLTLMWSWSRCGRRQLSMSSEMGSPQLAPQDTQPRGREPGPEPAQLAAHSPSVWVPCERQGSCSVCPGSREPSPGLLVSAWVPSSEKVAKLTSCLQGPSPGRAGLPPTPSWSQACAQTSAST